ncbi:MAG TPA: hypothetical protein VIW73_10290, partial [Candidatus Cybelea sp.]
MAPPESTLLRSFVADAVEWHRGGGEESLLHLIRSPHSGVAHDVAAAYATLARRTGALLEAIDAGRLALPPAERDDVLRFAIALRRVRAIPRDVDGERLRALIAEAFELSPVAPAAPRVEDVGVSDDGEIELAQAPPPEARAGVQPWQRHFSASAL